MTAIINNFRRSRHVQKNNHMIVSMQGVNSKEKAEGLIGKSVTWTSPAGKKLIGKVASSHGNKGCVRVVFETGMPGQSVGTSVELK